MSGIMIEEGAEMPNKPTVTAKESAVISATVRANEMLIEVCGPRGWNDTRESWLARGARRIGMSPRRARALFYQEPIRLSADEYLGIERAWQSASQAMEASAEMARSSAVLASSAAQQSHAASLRAESTRLQDRAEALGVERRGPAKEAAGD
jgi:hypothetical protein